MHRSSNRSIGFRFFGAESLNRIRIHRVRESFNRQSDYFFFELRPTLLTTYLLYIIYHENFTFNIISYHNVETKIYREYYFNLKFKNEEALIISRARSAVWCLRWICGENLRTVAMDQSSGSRTLAGVVCVLFCSVYFIILSIVNSRAYIYFI